MPQAFARLGIDVDAFVCHLFRAEMADMVEGASDGYALSLAIDRLSLRLAWHGCR